MSFLLMDGMIVAVRPVVSRMVMIVHVGCAAVRMFVAVLVNMFMGMAVSVFMAVFFAPVRVFMCMGVNVLVVVQMFVFVFSFHGQASYSSGCWNPSWVRYPKS